MPTPSETKRLSEFGVGHPPPRRSVFGNYRPAPETAGDAASVAAPADSSASRSDEKQVAAGPSPGNPEARLPGRRAAEKTPATLQASIDMALARAFLHRFLAKAFEDPDPEGWHWLTDQVTRSALRSAAEVLVCAPGAAFGSAAGELCDRLVSDAGEAFLLGHVTCFGHTVRGDCPMNEIEYGDIKADPLFQPHRLADLGAFYAAFGLELSPDAAQRQDHISIELEFMSVLAAKEAYALEHQFDEEQLAICREAQKKFLREHLGRWTPAFARRLARMAGDTTLGALARFTREFIQSECARFGVAPGSEDLLLRPIDAAAESLCTQCGIQNLPPGATGSPRED